MSLLAPLFLVGLGLLAIPIWLHRLQTDNPEREAFASTMLMEASQKRVHVRRKLRHLILMLLRLLLLALLVFAFSKPILKTANSLIPVDAQTLHIVVIDTTASMAADSRFSDAKEKVQDILADADASDLAQLFEFASTLKQQAEISTVPDLKASVESLWQSLEPAPVAGDMGRLMGGLSRLDWNRSIGESESAVLKYQVHIVSDMQASALPERYADTLPDLPADADIEFSFYPIADSDTENWALDFVRIENEGLRVGVRGYSTEEKELELAVSLDDASSNLGVDLDGVQNIQRQTIVVPADERANVFVSGMTYQAGLNAVKVELLVDDQLASDNSYNFVVDRSPPEPLLMLTTNPYSPAITYLSAVMSSISNVGGDPSAKNYLLQAESLAEFDLRTLTRYSWLIIDDIGALTASASNTLLEYIENGGAVFIASGALSDSQTSLPLTGHSLNVDLSRENQFFSVTEVDQSHPVLSGLVGWSDLNFSRNLSFSALESDNVLVSLSNGSPLLIEQQRARGKLLFFTSSLDNQWNDLPIKPLYVSLMSQIASYFSNSGRLKTQLYAGSAFSLEDVADGAGQLIDPAGDAVLALGNTNSAGAHTLTQTGFYQVYTSAGDTLIGVNVQPSESNLVAMNENELTRWQSAINDEDGVEASNTSLGEQAEVAVAAPQRQLWVAFLCLAAFILVGESVLANLRITRGAAV